MSVRVGRISGVPIVVHATCGIVFLLLSYAIGFGFIAQTDPSLSNASILGTGALVALAVFATVTLHEFGHVLAARRYGITTSAVRFCLFGGEARFAHEADGWRAQLAIALAGPAVNAALSLVLLLILSTTDPASLLSAMLFYLMSANALLAVVNIVPGYPLDGGRALSALLWRVLRDESRALRAAAYSGQALGLMSTGWGAFSVLLHIQDGSGFWTQSGDQGLWFIVIGWYIFDSAARALASHEPLRPFPVAIGEGRIAAGG